VKRLAERGEFPGIVPTHLFVGDGRARGLVLQDGRSVQILFGQHGIRPRMAGSRAATGHAGPSFPRSIRDPRGRPHVVLADPRARFHGSVDVVAGMIEEARIDLAVKPQLGFHLLRDCRNHTEETVPLNTSDG